MKWAFWCPFFAVVNRLVILLLQPVGDRLVMEHRVGSGHWFGACLSPQVSNFILDCAFEMTQLFVKLTGLCSVLQLNVCHSD
jgi:hypothetical protein